MASDKGLAASFTACLGFTGWGVWLESNWAALISAACSIGILLVNWYFRWKEHKHMTQQHDEHEDSSV